MSIKPTHTVGDLAAERLARIEVFETFGIDYCCGGKTTLAEASERAGCDAAEVIAALETSDAAQGAAAPEAITDWRAATLTDLTNHLVATHHEFMKRELPRVGGLMDKVVGAHGENHPEIHETATVFGALRLEIEGHLMKEEQVLFPLIQAMETTRVAGNAHCGTVNNPIGVMEREHDSAGDALRRLRELTDDYTTPADGCTTYRALIEGLAAIELDLHEHIHKENNILHPRAAQLEASLLTEMGGES